ncbi:hypothetical protein Tco_0910084 [Tanacetum coccineum]|uniref:Uncharacterized protein n=1 Tax=Tanacetum coccineum TaxID=301880 RepID=A0ABQ5CSW1_9ASTR
MDSESAHMVAASKVPMLKPENGNSALKTKLVEGVKTILPPTTIEEKAQKRLEMKARSTLMMGIPNEHQLKFNSIKDAKSLLEAVEKRFGGNAGTKKTHRNLLKRHLSPEWNTHAVVWKNKPELEIISMDDLYNNLKVYKPEVKGTSSTQNMAFVSSNNSGSTNEVVNSSHEVTAASTQANNLQPLHPDDLEEMDLRWQMAMLTMRARSATTATRGDILPRSAELQETKTITSNSLISCDGLGGYDWSDQAEERPTNYALMGYSSSSSDSEVSNDSTCSKSCLEIVEVHKSHNEQLLKDLKKSQLMGLAYKTGLESVEEKLGVYKKNESIYEQDIKELKLEIHLREIAIIKLRKKLEKDQQEKDIIQFNVDKLENASKSLNKIIKCQIVDNCKKCLGYNAVPPPYTGNFMPPTPDLSFNGLEEFINEPVVIKPVVENSKAKTSEAKPKVVRKNNDAPIIKDLVSDSEEEDVHQAKIKKKTVKSSFAKIKFVKPRNLSNEPHSFIYVRSPLMRRGWGKLEPNSYSDEYERN